MSDHGQLDQSLQQKLKHQILIGGLKPGQRIKENDLAERLRVSRTPIRQALIALTQQGLVQRTPNIGFTVTPLSVEEVKSIYPIVWSLEALALDNSFDLLNANHQELTDVNNDFRKHSKNPLKALESDKLFHAKLVEYSENQRLKEILEEEKQKIERYEKFYMEEAVSVDQSVKQHEEIIDNIKKGNAVHAKNALIKNWKLGMAKILERMK